MRKLLALLLLFPALALAQVSPGVGGLPQSPRFKTVTATASVVTPLVTLTSSAGFEIVTTGTNSFDATTQAVNGGGFNISTRNGANGTAIAVAAATPDVTFGGTISSTKACDSGFARVGPNLCWVSSNPFSSTSVSGSCQTVSAPTSAKYSIHQVQIVIVAGNAVSNRENDFNSWNDTACTQSGAFHNNIVREFAAVTAGTTLYRTDITVIAKATASGVTRWTNTLTSCTSCTMSVGAAIGYFD
jgi:hypothetical protein